jgi:hypothetical protein
LSLSFTQLIDAQMRELAGLPALLRSISSPMSFALPIVAAIAADGWSIFTAKARASSPANPMSALGHTRNNPR